MMAGADPYAEPVTPATNIQKQCIERLLKTPLRDGDEWYLVDCWWFKQWKRYVGFDSWSAYNVGHQSPHPGPIDNSKLFLDNMSQTLKENLLDELDYVLLPPEAWNKLVRWYGCLGVRGPIVRKVVEYGEYIKHCKVEVYLVELHLCENNNMAKVVKRHFSRADTVDTIEKEMRSLFHIPREKETRLWSNMYEQLNKPNSTVQDAALLQGQVLVIELRNEDGTWPRQSKHSRSTASSSQSSSRSPVLSSGSLATVSSTLTDVNGGTNSNYALNGSTFSNNGTGRYSPNGTSYDYKEPQSEPGLCGLSNLGNTCFMNSALQCLSNTPPLTEYFLNGQYGAEINWENPLGMRGEIAEAYADLIRQLWLSQSSFLAPRSFKFRGRLDMTQVGRLAPQFSGYQQQDSHELLAFLLDGLHEDLNQVKKKPYVAQREAEGRSDEIVAGEAWSNHCSRNNSIIVDIFHGHFESTLVCPNCSKISVTFDPFCYLSLPLPMKKRRSIEVLLVRADPNNRPMQEAMDQQISLEPESWQFESLAGGVEDSQSLETSPVTSRLSRKHGSSLRRLFSFNIVNSDGTAAISSLPREGNVLKLNLHSTVAMDWSLEIKKRCFDDKEAEAFEKHESVLQRHKATVTLRECIELFTATETLGEHDLWYCPACKRHQQVTKRIDLWCLPHILVVHLKHFSHNGCWRDKLDALVDFPIRDLNMSEFVCDPRGEPYIYDLIAVSNHYGVMGGGHYTAYCKNKSDGKWHCFDDSSVYPATEDQIVTKAAYVLFYQRRDGDRPASRPSSSSMREAPDQGRSQDFSNTEVNPNSTP